MRSLLGTPGSKIHFHQPHRCLLALVMRTGREVPVKQLRESLRVLYGVDRKLRGRFANSSQIVRGVRFVQIFRRSQDWHGNLPRDRD